LIRKEYIIQLKYDIKHQNNIIVKEFVLHERCISINASYNEMQFILWLTIYFTFNDYFNLLYSLACYFCTNLIFNLTVRGLHIETYKSICTTYTQIVVTYLHTTVLLVTSNVCIKPHTFYRC